MSRTSPPSPSAALPASILSPLRSRPTDWQENVSALHELTTYLTRHPPPTPEYLLRQLSDLSRHLAVRIVDLRSTLAKETCLCIVNLVRHLGAPFVKATAQELIPALLKSSAITKAVIRDSALAAARAIFDHGVVGLPLQTAKFIATSVQDRKLPPATRAAASQFVSMILVEDCIDGLADIGDSIHAAIRAGCTDPDMHVRELSRGNWVRLHKLDASFARSILPEFDHNVSNLLLHEIGGEVLVEETNNVKISPGGRSAQGVRRDGVVRGAQRVAVPMRAEGSPKEGARASPEKGKNSGASRVGARVPVARNAGLPPRLGGKVERDGFGVGTRKVGKPVRPPRRSVMPGTIIGLTGLTGGAMEKNEKRFEDKKKVKREQTTTGNGKLAHEPVAGKMMDAQGKHEVASGTSSPVSAASTSSELGSSISNDDMGNGQPKTVVREENGEEVANNSEKAEVETKENKVEQTKKQTAEGIPRLTPTSNSIENAGTTSRKGRISFLLGENITPGKDDWDRTETSALQQESSHGMTVRDLPPPPPEATPSSISSSKHQKGSEKQEETEKKAQSSAKSPPRQGVAHRMNLSSITNARNETPVRGLHSLESNQAEEKPSQVVESATATAETNDATRDGPVFDDLSVCKELGGVDCIFPEMRTWEAVVEDMERELDVARSKHADVGSPATTHAKEQIQAPESASSENDASHNKPQPPSAREKENVGPLRLASVQPTATGRKAATGNKPDTSRTKSRIGGPRPRNGKGEWDGSGLKGVGNGRGQVRGPRRSVMPGSVVDMHGGNKTDVTSGRTAGVTGVRKASEVAKTGRSKQTDATRVGQARVTGLARRSVMNGGVVAAGGEAAAAGGGKVESGRDKGRSGKDGDKAGGEKVGGEVKKRVCKEVHGVIEWMRRCLRERGGSWEEKSRALGGFCEACKGLRGKGIGVRLAEDCVGMLGEYVGETHHRVIRGALDGLFYLLLCAEGSSGGLQRGLERHEEVLRRTLWLKSRGKEDIRLAAGRVLGGFEVQFSPEVQVCLVMRAMGFVEKGKGKGRGMGVERRGGVLDGRLVEMGCAEVEKGLRSGQGFVWREELLEMVLRAMQVLGGDRRVSVRKSVEAVIEAVKQSLPEGAFGMACEKYEVRLAAGGNRH